jgi:hypothetical protein
LVDSTSATGWDDGAYNPVNAPLLPVGQGFFLIPTTPLTNTFAGTVAITVGSTNTVKFSTASLNYFIGEAVPYGGAATNSSVNLTGLADNTQVLTWNPTTQNYTTFLVDSTSASGWDDGAYNPVPPPVITPGGAFFLIPAVNNETWTQSL